MKEIIFVRHAKSDWGNELLKDIDRPLNERGYSDAYFLSEWYARNHKPPGLMITSTATRAMNTALIFARTMDFNMDNFRLEKSIYESAADNILNVIQQQDASVESLMLFGHNPGFTNTCNEVSEEMYFENVPTCGMVSFQFRIKKWSEPIIKKGALKYYQFPKDFKIRE